MWLLVSEYWENVTCGICDYKADNIESLETHVATCQTYKGCCKQMYNTIQDLKVHIHGEHKGGRWFVKNIFMNPNNSEYIVSQTHYSDQLFKKQKKWLDSIGHWGREAVMPISVPCDGSNFI